MKRWQITIVWARLLCVLLLSGAAIGQVPYTTTTSISATGSTGNYTLTGTVSGPGSSAVFPTGSLSFFDTTLGGNSLGSATLGAPVYSQVLTQKASLGDGLAEKIADNEVVAGDFNGDGKMDLALANSGGVVEIFLGNGDGTFGAETKIVLPSINGTDNSNTLPRIALGDFNGDGKSDLLVTCATTDVCILIGNGNGTFQTATLATAGAAGFPMGLIAADFNGDGKLDILLAMSGNSLYFAAGTGSGTFGTAVHTSTGTSFLAGIVSRDFNGDGHRDLIVLDGETSSGSIVGGAAWMYLGKGDGTFQTGTSLGVGGIRAAVGDFNGDGKLDVAYISGSSSSVMVYLSNGAGGFTSPSSQPASLGSYTFGDLALGDFNGDGKLDIACMAPAGTSTEVVLYLGTGSGTFAGTSYTLTGNGPTAIASADLNADGTPDLVIPNYSVYTTSIILDSVTATVAATLTGVNPKGGGTHNVEASFPAETNYKASTSGTVALTGTSIATSLSLSPNPTSSNYGQQVALTAVLNPYSYATLGTNGETISFYGNGTLLGTANLSSGVATYQTTSLPIGTDSLTASFAADGNFAASSASSSITVSEITPTITLSAASTEVYGTGNFASVHVSCNSACGNVDYKFDSGDWGTVALDASGNSSAPRPANDTAGTHTIQAIYLGNGTYNPATSNTVTYSITKATPTISWANPAAINYGTALSSTQLNASSGTGGSLAYNPVAGTVLGGGPRTLSVTLTPSDSTDYNTTTASVSLVVNKVSPTITVSAASTEVYGTPNTASVHVSCNASCGNVDFRFDGAEWGTVPLDSSGNFVAPRASTDPVGTHTIQVLYLGDANDNSATSNTVTYTITKATPAIAVSCSPNPITYGNQTTNCTESQSAGTGSLSWTINGGSWTTTAVNGSAGGFNGSSAGSYTIGVFYGGDSNYNSVSASTTALTIHQAPTIAELTSSVNPLVAGATTTLSTLVDTGGAYPSTGTVTWTSNGTTVGSSSVSTVSTTNLVPNSNSLLSSTWAGYCGTPTNLTATTADVAGPDGTATAWKIVTTGDVCHGESGSYGVLTAIPSAPTAGQSYVVSVWLRGASGGEVVAFGLNDCAEIGVSVTTSWVRYSLALPTIGANVSGCASGPRGFQMFEVHAGTVYFWGAQTEQASALGPYVETGNGSATGTGGIAQMSTSGLVGGTDSLVATYSGDNNYLPSTSPTVTEVVNKATPTITWATPAAISYGTALSGTQLNANSGGIAGSFAYTPASGTILNAGTQTLSVTFTPTDTADYFIATASVSLMVNPATPTITVSAASTEVYGTPNTATVHVSCNSACGAVDFKFDGADWGTVLLDSIGNYSAKRPPGDTVGTHTIQVEYSGDSNDNAGMSNLVSYTITKATPTITWTTPAAITYGTALSATQLNASSGGVAGSFVYSPAAGAILDAGTQTLSVTFTPNDTTDYSTASTTVSLAVNKATPTITLTLSSTTPTFGDTISATISVNCGNSCGAGSYIIDGSNTGNVPLGSDGTYVAGIKFPSAGSHTVQAQVLGNSNYNTAQTSVQTMTVAKATPTITWATPSAITYGTALSSTQLNASSGVAGSFAYSPASGTVLGGGAQPLSVTFTPTDTTDYNTASKAVSLVVNKVTPTITWSAPAAITYGTALSATHLNASSTTPGSFVYSPALGTVLAAGTPTLSVTFTPTDTSNFASATSTVPLTVNQAAAIIIWAPPSAITYGTPLTSTQLNASSGTSGTFTYSPIAGTVLATEIQTLSVSFTPTDTADYNSTTATVRLTVNKAATAISVTSTPNPAIYGDQIEFKFVFSGIGTLPTGQATVTDGVNALGTISIDGSGVAIYRTSDLTDGDHVLTATYMGDANYQ